MGWDELRDILIESLRAADEDCYISIGPRDVEVFSGARVDCAELWRLTGGVFALRLSRVAIMDELDEGPFDVRCRWLDDDGATEGLLLARSPSLVAEAAVSFFRFRSAMVSSADDVASLCEADD